MSRFLAFFTWSSDILRTHTPIQCPCLSKITARARRRNALGIFNPWIGFGFL
jgi:hypothetical protein